MLHWSCSRWLLLVLLLSEMQVIEHPAAAACHLLQQQQTGCHCDANKHHLLHRQQSP
jgi:hypothetical protein